MNTENTEESTSTAARQAGSYLLHLLATHPSYVRRWTARARGKSRLLVNRDAVSRVISDYLYMKDEQYDAGERALKDSVRRALAGELMTERTCGLFCDAFYFDRIHRVALEAMRRGLSAPDVPPLVVVATPLPLSKLTQLNYATTQLQEWHTIGADGRPRRHSTVHVIQALVDGLKAHPYTFDTNEATVAAVRGATSGPLMPTGEPNIYRVEFVFDQPLEKEQICEFEYTTEFHYSEDPPREFRRACPRPLDGLDLIVQFHRERVPSVVEWAVWASLDGPIVERRPVELDPYLMVHAYHLRVDGAIVGFVWDW